MRLTIITVLAVLAIMALSLRLIVVENQPVEVEYKPYLVTEKIPVYVERVVEVEVVVEVEKELRDFESRQKLQEWLDRHTIALLNGDCDDAAYQLQRLALSDGYIMNFEKIDWNEYNQLGFKYKLAMGTYHAINSAVIGNELWFIEPQTQEIKLAAGLD